jgi:LemA protein
MALGIAIGLIGVIALIAVGGYCRLLTLRREVESSWSRVEAALGRRHELVSEVAPAAQGRMAPPARETLLASLRRASDAPGIPERAEAENQLTQALHHLLTGAGSAADPAAGPAMRALEEQVMTAETEIAVARESYNQHVLIWNRRIDLFPWSLIARGFQPAEYLILDEPARCETEPVPF